MPRCAPVAGGTLVIGWAGGVLTGDFMSCLPRSGGPPSGPVLSGSVGAEPVVSGSAGRSRVVSVLPDPAVLPLRARDFRIRSTGGRRGNPDPALRFCSLAEC